MFDEKEFKHRLQKYPKAKLIDLCTQKCFDVYATIEYGEGGQGFTSGYIDADIENETKTYIYCRECTKKDEEIKRLKRIITEQEKKIALLKGEQKGGYTRLYKTD